MIDQPPMDDGDKDFIIQCLCEVIAGMPAKLQEETMLKLIANLVSDVSGDCLKEIINDIKADSVISDHPLSHSTINLIEGQLALREINESNL